MNDSVHDLTSLSIDAIQAASRFRRGSDELEEARAVNDAGVALFAARRAHSRRRPEGPPAGATAEDEREDAG